MATPTAQLTDIIQEGAPYDLNTVLNAIQDKDLLQVTDKYLAIMPLEILDDILVNRERDPDFRDKLYEQAVAQKAYIQLSRFLPFENPETVWNDIIPGVDADTFRLILNSLPPEYVDQSSLEFILHTAEYMEREDLFDVVNSILSSRIDFE